MKKGNFLVFIYIFAFLFTLIGATFAWFAADITSSNVISMTSGSYGVNLLIYPLYNEHDIIPTNDDDISIAYENECVDNLGNGACYVYTITVENTGDVTNYSGTINFNLNNITNLKYKIIDEDDLEYYESTSIVTGTDQSLGDSFSLEKNESKKFKIIIWLSNLDIAQDDVDSNGNFSASVTYQSDNSGKVTGIFSS